MIWRWKGCRSLGVAASRMIWSEAWRRSIFVVHPPPCHTDASPTSAQHLTQMRCRRRVMGLVCARCQFAFSLRCRVGWACGCVVAVQFLPCMLLRGASCTEHPGAAAAIYASVHGRPPYVYIIVFYSSGCASAVCICRRAHSLGPMRAICRSACHGFMQLLHAVPAPWIRMYSNAGAGRTNLPLSCKHVIHFPAHPANSFIQSCGMSEWFVGHVASFERIRCFSIVLARVWCCDQRQVHRERRGE